PWLVSILALCLIHTAAHAAAPVSAASAAPAHADAASRADVVSAIQDPALVAAEVEDFLHAQAGTYPGSVHVTVETPHIHNQPACDQLQAYLPSGQRLRSSMSVGVRCVSPETWTSHVKATLSIQGFYYVANRN